MQQLVPNKPLDLHVFVIPMCSARTKGSGGKEEC